MKANEVAGTAPPDVYYPGRVRRFHLAEIETTSKGKGVLKYLIRLGKRGDPTRPEDARIDRAAPTVVGARIH